MESNFQSITPLLHVSSSVDAETYYCDKLGFTKEWEYRPATRASDPGYLSLTRDGVRLHISSFAEDAVAGGVAVFTVRDVDALFAEFCARAVTIELSPTDQSWGNREMYVRDPDSNGLRFVQLGE